MQFLKRIRWWRRELRQTRLGKNSEGNLIIIYPKPPGSVTPPPYILKLPDEILYNIFENLTDVISWRTWRPTNISSKVLLDLTAVLLVCRRFNQIADPLLYQSAAFDIMPRWNFSIRHFKYYRCMKLHSSRAKSCQYLWLYVHRKQIGLTSKDMYMLEISDSLISSLSNVRTLNIDGSITRKEEWDIPSRVTEYMLRLENLTLKRGKWSEIFEFIEGSDLPILKRLIIVGYRDQSGKTMVRKDKIGKAPITELYVLEFLGGRECLKNLLRWPRALETFEFQLMDSWVQGDTMLFETLWEMLLSHIESIRHIHIHWLDMIHPESSVFHAHTFTNLVYLELHLDNIRWELDIAVEALFGGSLRTLVLNCLYPRYRSTSLLNPKWIDWLGEFVREVGILTAGSRREIVLKNTGRKWSPFLPKRMMRHNGSLRNGLRHIGYIAEAVDVKYSYEVGVVD
ncbi:uncharacterized protein F4822DRAFT_366734 [Hypoxylon trugodes]|uniref:uncharacterized protein n=1 Tax=Hypoxylon trugodes TaxID=326681 RepID=UPI00219BF556|nr:uncharacterized protein F4822DRAFT_366734 [Hypoxylon trugodes]KAI1384554.1 hypothetical protein F4822DRAFT_366734 [Hypoxylon trugodes]